MPQATTETFNDVIYAGPLSVPALVALGVVALGVVCVLTWLEARNARRWLAPVLVVLRDLAPGPGYAAALAVEGSGWRLRCWSVEMAEIGKPPSRRGL